MWVCPVLALLLAGCAPDADGDGHPDKADCAAADAAIHPGAVELCNGVDDDCDGLTDESDSADAATWYRDGDVDGYGDPGAPARSCEPLEGHVASASDCDDADAAVSPAAHEDCATAHDDDCDGLTDEVGAAGCTPWFLDEDGDGYGTAASSCTCEAVGDYSALVSGDCDDSRASVHPDRDEDCATASDDDCSGTGNDVGATGCTWFYVDADGDGFGDVDDPGECTCATTPERQAADPGDCDDARALTHPGATETCSGHDDDCDGTVDEGDAIDALTWYADADTDGYGDPDTSDRQCEAPTGYLEDATDCDDADATVNPAATEVCDDGDVDEDCDGLADDDDPGVDPTTRITGYPDDDGDGYGDEDEAGTEACELTTGHVLDATDCDDTDDEVNPGATEVCNEVDDDCDGDTDPATSADAVPWYPDTDLDGYGDDSAAPTVACDAPSGTVDDATDCDDTDDAVHPAAAEVCNEVDDDCDGDVDVGAIDATTWYPDDDGDGYGDDDSSTDACEAPTGYLDEAGDCDDEDEDVNPGATEWCDDGVDQDCDGDDTGDSDCAPSGTTTDFVALVSGGSTISASQVFAASEDLDGDDAYDLLMGHTTAASGYGAVHLYSDLLGDSPSSTTSTYAHRWYGAASGDDFGSAIATFGDLDGDGGPELAIGAPGNDDGGTGAGAVYIFSGDGGSGSSSTNTSYASYTLEGAAAGDGLGEWLANAGDLDGDGYDDLALGAPYADLPRASSGAVYVACYDGWASGTVSAEDLTRFSGERLGDGLQQATRGGDLDGDGYDDLVLSSSNSDHVDSQSGAAWVWFGPLEPGDHQVAAAPLRIAGDAGSDQAGYDVAAVDLDADEVVDLAVGAAGTDDPYSSAGSVGVFYGPLPWGELWVDEADLTLTGVASSDSVGMHLGAGDIDGDGWGDLALGVPDTDTLATGYGGVFVFYGPLGTGSLDLADADASIYSIGGLAAGPGLLVAPLSDRGFDDIVYFLTTSSGNHRVEVHSGGTRETDRATAPVLTTDDDGDGYSEADGDCDDGRATRAPDLTEVCDEGSDEDCDGYADRCMDDTDFTESDLEILVGNDVTSTKQDLGQVVRIVGDLNGDGALDVAVQDDLYDSGAGRVLVFFGPVPSGTTSAASADVVIEGVTAGDAIGAVLDTAGDLDADGFDDLFIGAPEGSYAATEDGFAGILRGGPDLEGTISMGDADWVIYGGTDEMKAGYGGGGCDLDGDGYDDLVVGAPEEYVDGIRDVGTLSVIYGPLSTGAHELPTAADLVFYGSAILHNTGLAARCTGDLTNDGQDDLLAITPGWGMGWSSGGSRERVLLFEGPLATGILDEVDAVLAVAGRGGNYESDWDLGDLDGDGLPDLVLSTTAGEWAVLALAGARGVVELEEDAFATFSDSTDSIDESTMDLAVGDLDRDGYDDLVVGSADGAGDAGQVRILYGPLDGDYDLASADLTLSGDGDSVLGASLDVGDLEQDGFADIALGLVDAGSTSYEPGAFAVVRGGWTASTGGATTPHEPEDDWDGDGTTGAAGDCHDGDATAGPAGTEVCGNALDEDCDGYALECAPDGDREDLLPGLAVDSMADGPDGYMESIGDVDGDGLVDHLVVDDYYATYVLGSALPMVGLVDASDYAIGTVTTSAARHFHLSTAPDVDGDGLPEWVVGTYDVSSGSSGTAIYVIDTDAGTGTRAATSAAWVFTAAGSTASWGKGAEGGADAFGTYDAVMALADGDTYDATGDGAVLAWGIDSLTTGSFDETDADLIIVGEAGDSLGSRLNVLDDLDGDGLAEIGMSTSRGGYTTDEVTTIWSSSDGTGTIDVADCWVQLQDTTTYVPMLSWSPGDLDGDGTHDLAVSSEDSYTSALANQGAVFVWSGLPTTGTHSPVSGDLDIEGTSFQQFVGSGVAELLDLDGDGNQDLVVGASSKYGSTDDLGRVHVWYGPLTLSGSVDAVDSDGTIVPDASIDDFGEGLHATGDVDGDGYDDLWVGADSTLGILARGGP